jgi:hypothetical protein
MAMGSSDALRRPVCHFIEKALKIAFGNSPLVPDTVSPEVSRVD